MYRKTAAAVTLLLVSCVFSSCRRDILSEHDFERVAHPGPTAAPLLLIGVDGLEWNVILTMLRDGSQTPSTPATPPYSGTGAPAPTKGIIIMPTRAQTKANRNNAKKSTGPRTGGR